MWRFVRIVERQLFDINSPNEDRTTNFGCTDEFTTRKTIFGRYYTPQEAYIAYHMAISRSYISDEEKSKAVKQKLSLSADGAVFASFSGLLEEQAKLLKAFSSIIAVVLSAIAIAVSIFALNKHDAVTVELNNNGKDTSQTTR